MKEKVSCGVIRDLLPLYADEVAGPESRALVEEHLNGCEGCRRELEQLTRNVSLPPEQNEEAEMKRWKKALSRKVRRLALFWGLAAVLLLVLVSVPLYGANFGVPASLLEADSRRNGAAEGELLTQVINEDIGFLLFDKGNGRVKFNVYVNYPGLDFGYHFRHGASKPAQDGLFSLYSYQTEDSTLVFSLTGSGVVRIEQTIEDNTIPGTVYLVDPGQPWAVIFTNMPKSEKHAYLTAYNADGEVVPFTTCYIG